MVWNTAFKGALLAAQHGPAMWKGYKNIKQQIKAAKVERGRKVAAFRNHIQRQNNKSASAKFAARYKPMRGGANYAYGKSLCAVKYKPTRISKIYRTLSNRAIYEEVGFGTIATPKTTGNLRTQNVQVVDTIYSGAQTVALADSAFSSLPPGNPLATTAASPGFAQNDAKLYLNYCLTEIEFHNQTESPVTMIVYNLMSKTTKATLVNPDTDWQVGLGDVAGSGTLARNFPDAKPTASKVFNINWKIVKKTHVELMPGKVHKHTFLFKPQSIVNHEYFANYGQVRGLTYSTMCVAKGAIGTADTAPDYGPSVTATLAPVKILYSLKHYYFTKILSVLPSTYFQANNLTSMLLVPGTAHVWQVDEETGDVEDTAAVGQVG